MIWNWPATAKPRMARMASGVVAQRDVEKQAPVGAAGGDLPKPAQADVRLPGGPNRTANPARRCVMPDVSHPYSWRPQR